MPDVVGRMFAFLLGVVMMFMVPLTIIMLKQDDTKQALIDDAVVEFIDNARAAGEITPTAYRQFVKRVNDAHGGCNIDIVYESAMETPEPLDSDGNPVAMTGHATERYGYKRSLQAYTTKDIIVYMFGQTDGAGNVLTQDFPMREGGYISAKVENRTSTPGTQMLRMFLPQYTGKAIVSSYGGYVGNNKQ